MDFEQELASAIRKQIIKQVADVRFIGYGSGGNGKNLPANIIEQVWAGIDWPTVVKDVSAITHDRVCSLIVQSVLTEIKTDVKKVLSIEGVREKLRHEAYPKIMQVLDGAK